MGSIAIFGTLLSTAASGIGKLLQNSAFVLLLLGAMIGGHFGAKYGRWQQARADAYAARHSDHEATPPRTRPIRDFLRVVFNAQPDPQAEADEESP